MSRFIKERLNRFDAYTPGEQLNDKNYIKLNTNESPYPPGEEVLKAINTGDLENLRLYPSPSQETLKNAIKEKLSNETGISLDAGNIFTSNGSDDILNFAFMAYTSKDKAAVYPDISYGFYQVFADFQDIKKKEMPLTGDFRIDYKDYLNLDPGETGLIVFANPNAPTGIQLELSKVEEIVKSNPDTVVLVDEAYIDFGGDTAVPLIDKYDNLLVCRTYSKSASLAGARLGFAAGNSNLIADLELIKYSTNPYSVNRMTELVGLAVLRENEYYYNNCRRIIETREWTRKKLEDLGFNVFPSKANFLFVGTGETTDSVPWCTVSGEELYLYLKEQGILVRWFNKDRIRDFLRITIGKDEDMESLIKVLEERKNQNG